MATTTDLSTYQFNHTMIRVKDPARSLKFYEFMGMSVIRKAEFPEAKFDLYFLAHDGPGTLHHGKSASSREGILELTHNYGTENDPNYSVNNGNEKPHLGLSHISMTVDHIPAACKRLEDAGYTFVKKYDEAPLKGFAFVRDPDGYYVELIAQNFGEALGDAAETDPSTYRFHHTMLRVKDIKRSREWYENVLGMKHVLIYPVPENTDCIARLGSEMHFFTYVQGKNLDLEQILPAGLLHTQGVLELGYTPGDENDAEINYHNGNNEPQGFGHLCITVDDLDAACARFEQLNVTWKKRLTDGRMRTVAFLMDPDGYWVEVIQNDQYSDKHRV